MNAVSRRRIFRGLLSMRLSNKTRAQGIHRSTMLCFSASHSHNLSKGLTRADSHETHGLANRDPKPGLCQRCRPDVRRPHGFGRVPCSTTAAHRLMTSPLAAQRSTTPPVQQVTHVHARRSRAQSPSSGCGAGRDSTPDHRTPHDGAHGGRLLPRSSPCAWLHACLWRPSRSEMNRLDPAFRPVETLFAT